MISSFLFFDPPLTESGRGGEKKGREEKKGRQLCIFRGFISRTNSHIVAFIRKFRPRNWRERGLSAGGAELATPAFFSRFFLFFYLFPQCGCARTYVRAIRCYGIERGGREGGEKERKKGKKKRKRNKAGRSCFHAVLHSPGN